MKLRPINLLLVEDCFDHAIYFGASLKNALSYEHNIQHALSLEEAFELMARNQYDLCVLDLGLPNSFGIETLEIFLENAGESYPVIVMTAIDDDSIGEEALRIGALDYLIKGRYGADQQARAIRYALERSRRRVELEEARQDLQSFAHAAAHDLRAPIRTIDALLKLIEPAFGGSDLPESVLEPINMIKESAQQATILIDSLLKFSVLGAKSVEIERFELDAVVARAVQTHQSAAKECGAAILHGTLPMIDADPHLIEHVLLNLIGNAIKYRSEAPLRIEISATVQSGMATISVKDNGIGVEPEFCSRVFEPFKRVSSAPNVEGAGLGLTICKRLVEAHNGRIWLESIPGKGCNFKFSLPVKRQSEATDSKSAKRPSSDSLAVSAGSIRSLSHIFSSRNNVDYIGRN